MAPVFEVWNAVHAIVASSDMITLGIALVILLAAGYTMQSMEGLITTTVVALVAFGLALYVRAITLGGQKAADYATTDWHNFTTLNALTLLAYGLTFAVGIAVVRAVLSAIGR